MNDVVEQTVTLTLAYHTGVDDPARGIFTTRPVDPDFTDGFPSALDGKPLQVQLTGSARALEAFGTYLIALGRLDSSDPDPHEHFEDIADERGGKVHLIVRRRPGSH